MTWPYGEVPTEFRQHGSSNTVQWHTLMLMHAWGLEVNQGDGTDSLDPQDIPMRRSWAPTAVPVKVCEGDDVP